MSGWGQIPAIAGLTFEKNQSTWIMLTILASSAPWCFWDGLAQAWKEVTNSQPREMTGNALRGLKSSQLQWIQDENITFEPVPGWAWIIKSGFDTGCWQFGGLGISEEGGSLWWRRQRNRYDQRKWEVRAATVITITMGVWDCRLDRMIWCLRLK